jgi:hypothetical protein
VKEKVVLQYMRYFLKLLTILLFEREHIGIVKQNLAENHTNLGILVLQNCKTGHSFESYSLCLFFKYHQMYHVQ